MASSSIAFARPPCLDRFLQTVIGTERNGMDLSVLSMLARLGRNPWTEAARLAGLPRAVAVDSLAGLIADLPEGSRPRADARAIALCLVPLLPSQDHLVLGASPVDEQRCDRMMVAMLAGGAPSTALAFGLPICVCVWSFPNARPVGASEAAPGASAHGREQP